MSEKEPKYVRIELPSHLTDQQLKSVKEYLDSVAAWLVAGNKKDEGEES